MEHIDRLYYLASELLAGVKVQSVDDWKLELQVTRKRAQRSIQKTALHSFWIGAIVTGIICWVSFGW